MDAEQTPSQGLPEDKVGAVHGATMADGPRFLKLHGKEDPKGFVVSVCALGTSSVCARSQLDHGLVGETVEERSEAD